MPSPDATWVLGIDFAFVDARLGAKLVNGVLGEAREYAEPHPRVDGDGRLIALLVPQPSELRFHPTARGRSWSLALRRRPNEPLEIACTCPNGRFLCDHAKSVLIDLAAHPGLRDAVANRAPTGARLAELPKARREALDERTLEERLARWVPPRADDHDLLIDVAVAVARDEDDVSARRPCVELRCRRPPSRKSLDPRDLEGARLPPRYRRLFELTHRSHSDTKAMVATRAQASLLIHFLHEASTNGEVLTAGFRRPLRFAKGPAAPRVEREGEALIARWYSADGRPICDAEAALLFTGPFPYLWSTTHEVFVPLAPGVDQDVAWGLQLSPRLPLRPQNAARIGRELLGRCRGRGVALPPPEAFGLPPIEAPSFVLRLGGSPLDVRGELSAVYSIGSVRILPPEDALTDGRDKPAEESAQAVALATGLALNDDGLLVASEDRAIELWQKGILALRASESPRVEVLVDAALARVKIGAPVRARVMVASASGWLDTKLDFAAGDVKVEMKALRAALVARSRWVSLEDGTLAKISDEIASLVDESAALLDGEPRGRVAAHHLGRVERWVEEFGGEVDEHVAALRARMRALSVREDADLPSNLKAALRPYQLQGVAWLAFLRDLGAGGILADDMGLGKTLMTLAFLARWKEDAGRAPSLVVCPTSVVGNWAREAKRFTPGLRLLVLSGEGRAEKVSAIAEHDLIVSTYGLLRRDIEWLEPLQFRCVVLDEAQNVKNDGAATARAAQRLRAEMRLALTGTPVENRLRELWSIMSFANPGMLGGPTDFEERFERPIGNDPSGPVAERLRAIIRPFLLRRTKSEVLGDLPPKTEIDRVCIFRPPQKRLYDALALTLRESVKKRFEEMGMGRSSMSVLTAILRLRQMACDPRLIDPAASAEASAKRVAFMDLVRELVSEGRRALVFSQFVQLLSLWREDLDREGIQYEYLDGSSQTREAIVSRFQDGAAPLFLISLKAGGAGLNLTAADTVIHCDPWWNPAVEDQATDRAHRIGQSRAVTVVRLVAHGTIEEKIAMLKGKKRELASAVIGGEAGALRGLTEADVRALLGDVDGQSDSDRDDGPVIVPPRSELATPLEVDEVRAIIRRLDGSGLPQKDLARRVGVPASLVSKLLNGRDVPIAKEIAERIRALQWF